MGAVGRLVFDGGVPPGVEVDDGIGAGEVEAGAAGLERDQEDRDARLLVESVDPFDAILRRAVEIFVFNAVGVEGSANVVEHLDELAEDEHAVSAVDRFVDDLAERAELAAVVRVEVGVWQLHQPRIARDLSQPGERGENLNLRLADALLFDLAEDALANLTKDLLVELGLLLRERHDHLLLDLVRQVLGDVALHAPHDERLDRRPQSIGGLHVSAVDGPRNALLEHLELPE